MMGNAITRFRVCRLAITIVKMRERESKAGRVDDVHIVFGILSHVDGYAARRRNKVTKASGQE